MDSEHRLCLLLVGLTELRLARPAISLKKVHYEPFKGRVLFHTTYSQFFKENLHLFDALDFLAELTQHIPPPRLQLIRRYGLYSSRIKGRWSRIPHVAARAPEGWQRTQASTRGRVRRRSNPSVAARPS